MSMDTQDTRTRRGPVAQCRLCSAVCSFEAVTPEDLRHSLRAFMAEHRHDGLADIVIDISDEDDGVATPQSESSDRLDAAAGVS